MARVTYGLDALETMQALADAEPELRLCRSDSGRPAGVLVHPSGSVPEVLGAPLDPDEEAALSGNPLPGDKMAARGLSDPLARAAAASRTQVRRCKEVLPAAALGTGRVRHRGGGLYREPTTKPRCRRAPRPGLSHQIHRKEAPRLSTPDDPKSAQLDCSTDVFVRYSG